MKKSLLTMILIAFWLVGCGETPAENTAVPEPTAEPVATVVDAILAANQGDFIQADRLLDITAVATEAEYAATQPYWLWLTSQQRVNSVDIQIEETNGDALHLFVALDNDNYPRQQTRFWIRWNGTQWETFIP